MVDKLAIMLLAELSCVAPDMAIDAIGMLCSAAHCGTSPPLGKLIESLLLTGVNAPFTSEGGTVDDWLVP